jgi:hypothetical protein
MNQASRANGASPHAGPYQGHPQHMKLSTDQAVETAALAGAAAVQKLVAERNELRTRLAAQEQETAAYRALNKTRTPRSRPVCSGMKPHRLQRTTAPRGLMAPRPPMPISLRERGQPRGARGPER